MLADKKQKQRIHVMLHRIYPDARQREEYKRKLVRDFTNGRADSTTQMQHAEAEALINAMQRMGIVTELANSPANRMRRKIISMAHEMAWVRADNPKRADMQRINNWCIKSGYLHKPLNDYTEKELPQLVSQFGMVHSSYLNDLRK